MEAQRQAATPAWSKFFHERVGGTIFQSPEMFEVYRDVKGLRPELFLASDQGQIVGSLISVLQSWGGEPTSFRFARSLILGRPVGDGAAIGHLLRTHEEWAARTAIFSEIRPFLDQGDLKDIAVSSGFEWEQHLNFLLDLSPGEEGLWNGMSKSRRKGLKLAEREGLRFRIVDRPDLVDVLHELISETYRRAGLSVPDRSLFRSAHRVLGKTQRWIALVAEDGGGPVAARAVLASDGILHDWYAGSNDRGRAVHADEWLVWQILRQGVEKGFRLFEFGGAGRMDEDYGPREFKRRFGGREVNPGRLFRVHRPIQYRMGMLAWKALERIRRE